MATAQIEVRRERLDRYEQRTAAGVTVLALLFVVVYAVPVLWPEGPDLLLTLCRRLNLSLWVVFAVDLVVRVSLAPSRGRYLLAHPLDVVSVLLPALRPLRVLRVFTAGQALFARGSRLPLLRAAQAVVLAAAVLVFISALAVLDAERGADNANIATFPDALWWAATTITTVGYGDRFPVTGTGRMVAAALMFVGISLLGIVTASIAAWFLARTSEDIEEESAAVEDRLAALDAQLSEVRTILVGQFGDPKPTTSGREEA